MKKTIITHFINFTLSISIFLLIVLSIFSITIFNEKYLLNYLTKENYYEKSYQSIVEHFENNLIQSGIEENIIEKVIKKEYVIEDINSIIANIYTNKQISINSINIRTNFNNTITDILKEHNRYPSIEEQNDIKVLEDKLANIYEKELLYSPDLINKLYQNINILKKLTYVLILIISLIIINLLAIIIYHLKDIKKNIGIALLSSGLIFTAIKYYIGDTFKYILFINKNFSELVINIITNILKYVGIIGLILGLLGFILIILSIFKKKNQN
ncbi:MAG: hypothetical protein HFI36_06080 [Bacilli bacterium]|jgi:hypothetical protein|nr:hypothetical protein [Bacilli bacterium]